MKTKRILSLILIVSIVITSFPLVVQAGEQTEEETVSQVTQVVEKIDDKMQTAPKPAEITEHFDIDSKDKFIEFMTTPKYHTINCETTLLCDIDMDGAALKPIDHYYGTFNGHGHVVSNISLACFAIDNHGTISGIGFRGCQQVSFAGYTAAAGFVINNERDGMINDCFTENDIINEHGSCVAGFVAINKGKITRCKSEGKVIGNKGVGGFVGENNEGTIIACQAIGNVTGNEGLGGFVGYNYRGEIITCTATGEVNGKDQLVGFVGEDSLGGFVGENYGTITGCTAEGNVTGNSYIGGFVGGNNKGIIIDSIAKGKVIGNKGVGGFVGFNNFDELGHNGEEITNCIAEGEVNGKDQVGGFVGENNRTIIECIAKGKVIGNEDVGGFVGENNEGYGEISNCRSRGNVRGNSNVGGFVGLSSGGISGCAAEGHVTGNQKVGGFVGYSKSYSGSITNCTATGDVTGNIYIGGFVGENNEGTITGCIVEGKVIGNEGVGGFVGYNSDILGYNEGKITNCTAKGEIKGKTVVGGFVGFNERHGNIIDCHSTGNVVVTGNYQACACAGGFVGLSIGKIIDCSAEGHVTGNQKVGGFVGYNKSYNGSITNCTAKGEIKGQKGVGGFVGENNEGTITGCIAEGNVIGNEDVGGFVGLSFGGTIIDCNSTANVTVTGNNQLDAIGNEKTLDKKKVLTGTITGILLAGATGGVAFGTIGFDKVESTLKNAWDSAKTFFNEKVMSNSNYKKVIGALIALGIAAIIIIVPIKLRKRNHIDIPIGGFVGYNGGKIENCTSSGNVTVERVSMHIAAGGFVGINEVTGTITNCESEEYVHTNTKLSGKAGGFVGDNNGRIYKSKFSGERVYLSTGIIYKDDCCGGFAGKNSAGGVIDWCEVGELKAEPVGNGKKVGKEKTIVETTNKTKGGGLVGVAGKLSITTNCTCNARRQANIGEVGVKVCYKIEKRAVVTNCFAK